MRKESSFLEIGLNRKRNSRRNSFVARTSERFSRRRFGAAFRERRFQGRRRLQVGRKIFGGRGAFVAVVVQRVAIVVVVVAAAAVAGGTLVVVVVR